MKNSGILFAISMIMIASCGNGPSKPLNTDTSQKVKDTFNNRKDTRYYPDSTNVPSGPSKQ